MQLTQYNMIPELGRRVTARHSKIVMELCATMAHYGCMRDKRGHSLAAGVYQCSTKHRGLGGHG